MLREDNTGFVNFPSQNNQHIVKMDTGKTFVYIVAFDPQDMGDFEVVGVVRATGASCVVQSAWSMYHSGTTAGMMNVTQGLKRQALSTGFDVTSASTVAGLSVNPGTAGVWTFQVIAAHLENYI